MGKRRKGGRRAKGPGKRGSSLENFLDNGVRIACRTFERRGFVRRNPGSGEKLFSGVPKRKLRQWISGGPGMHGHWMREFTSAEMRAYKRSDEKVVKAAQSVLLEIYLLRQAMASANLEACSEQGIRLGRMVEVFNSVIREIDPQAFKRMLRSLSKLALGPQKKAKDAKEADAERRRLMSYSADSGVHDSTWALAAVLAKSHPLLGGQRSFYNSWKNAPKTED